MGWRLVSEGIGVWIWEWYCSDGMWFKLADDGADETVMVVRI